MNPLYQLLLDQLPWLTQTANKLTGANLPEHIVEDGKKLYEFVQLTIENLKQIAPLTPEDDAKLDAQIEEITSRDYWKPRA